MKHFRRTYPREEYLEKRAALYKLVQDSKHVHLDLEEHNISGETAAPIIYMDSKEGPKFDALNRKQFDCREIKLINPTQPAIELHFTIRHKYQIERKPTAKRVQAYMATLLDELGEYLEKHPNEEEAKQKAAFYRKIYNNPTGYEVAISNYFRYYRYPYVNYRYADGKGFSTASTHLIASYLIDEDDDQEEYDRFPRYNVIFVDMDAIARPRPANDHARTANYLNAFNYQIDVGTRDLFIKTPKGYK